MKPRERYLSVEDAAFLERIYDTESKAGVYLKGPELRRARRLLKLGMVAEGRLDPRRYAVLTPKGERFVKNKRGGR